MPRPKSRLEKPEQGMKSEEDRDDDDMVKACQPSSVSQSKPAKKSRWLIPNELLVAGAIVSVCIAFLIYYVQEESPDKVSAVHATGTLPAQQACRVSEGASCPFA